MKKVFLKPGREKSILLRHPWLFSGGIERVEEPNPAPGETVQVCSHSGQPLGWAAYSPTSQIRLRMWSFDPAEAIDAAFLRKRLEQSLAMRKNIQADRQSQAFRLVNAESDGLPGLIVDRYGDPAGGLLVMQCLSVGADYWRETIADLLQELTGFTCIYERSDVDVRRLEGLPERTGPLRGSPPPGRLCIQENGLRFWVDVLGGHKTGFYLDQRDNRARLRDLAAGREVLNCFSYTGGFAAFALAGGARSVLSIDTSADALALGAENISLNNLPAESAAWQEGDVFQVLRTLRDQARSFDLIVLDPPKFAPTIAQAERAARGYKDINLLAFKLLRPGGLLFTFSCSGGISADLFQKIVAGAALDAGVEASILETMTQAADHPIALNFPEGAYLKGLICYVH